jgi:hypothetical protein
MRRIAVLTLVVAAMTASAGQARVGCGPTAKELKGKVATAITAEKRALKALDSDPGSARGDLESSLSDLRSALAGASGAGGGDAVSSLKQAILGDELAIKYLPKKAERGMVRAKINIAIVRKETAEHVFATLPGGTEIPPQSMPINASMGITAKFNQDAFSTLYWVDQTNATLYPATITWTLAPPASDPPCNGFLPTSGATSINAQKQKTLTSIREDEYFSVNGHEPAAGANETLDSVAIWWHADVSEGGLCNHAGNAYDPTKYGHDGTVSVTVTNKYWSCTASFRGTLDGSSKLAPDAAEPTGNPNGWRGPATCTSH